MMDEQFDPARFEALEEVVYHTSNALEMLMRLMIEKGYFSEDELLKKMAEYADHEDVEELGHDADALREPDADEE